MVEIATKELDQIKRLGRLGEDTSMTIRTFMAGDDLAQVGIYNEAAAELPKFKPATVDEVPPPLPGGRILIRRRRFFALVNNRPMGYASFSSSGRISYPWCRKGHEALAEPLLEHVLATMKQRGLKTAWAAYRHDWLPVA